MRYARRVSSNVKRKASLVRICEHRKYTWITWIWMFYCIYKLVYFCICCSRYQYIYPFIEPYFVWYFVVCVAFVVYVERSVKLCNDIVIFYICMLLFIEFIPCWTYTNVNGFSEMGGGYKLDKFTRVFMWVFAVYVCLDAFNLYFFHLDSDIQCKRIILCIVCTYRSPWWAYFCKCFHLITWLHMRLCLQKDYGSRAKRMRLSVLSFLV